jgi:hypothetical protein
VALRPSGEVAQGMRVVSQQRWALAVVAAAQTVGLAAGA